MAGKRQARLNEQLKRELTALIQFEVRDPRVGSVTITDVEVTPDLYHAKVFFTLHGEDEERKKALSGLQAAAGFLRGELGRRMHIRRAPELQFAFDETLAHALRIERLLHEARTTTATQPDPETAPGTDEDDAG
jgi:ribosome-binding factor A